MQLNENNYSTQFAPDVIKYASPLIKDSMTNDEKKKILTIFSTISKEFLPYLSLMAQKLCKKNVSSTTNLEIARKVINVDCYLKKTYKNEADKKELIEEFSKLFSNYVEKTKKLATINVFLSLIEKSEMTLLFGLFTSEETSNEERKKIISIIKKETTQSIACTSQFVVRLNITRKTKLTATDFINLIDCFKKHNRPFLFQTAALILTGEITTNEIISAINSLSTIKKQENPDKSLENVTNSIIALATYETSVIRNNYTREIQNLFRATPEAINADQAEALAKNISENEMHYSRKIKILESFVRMHGHHGNLTSMSLGKMTDGRNPGEMSMMAVVLYSFPTNINDKIDIVIQANKLVTSTTKITDACNTIEAIGATPEDDRNDVIKHVKSLLDQYRETSDIHLIIKALAAVPRNDRTNVIEHVKSLLKRDWNVSEVSLIINTIAVISKDRRHSTIDYAESLSKPHWKAKEISVILKTIERIRKNEQTSVIAYAKPLLNPKWDEHEISMILDAIANIRKDDRENVITHAKPLIQKADASTSRDLLLTIAAIKENDRENVIQSALPWFDDKTPGFLKRNILTSIAATPSKDREDVCSTVRQLCPETASATDQVISQIATILKKDRAKIIKLTKSLIREEMNNYQRSILLSAVKMIPKDQLTKATKHSNQLFTFDKKGIIDWDVFFREMNKLND